MRPSSMHYFPHTWPFLAVLVFLFAVVLALVEFRVLTYAYERMGIGRRYVLGVLLLSLLGSYVNIPVAEYPARNFVKEEVVFVAGIPYVVPQVEHWPGTVLAVNVGGALIPTILSIYLLVRNRLYLPGLVGVAIVTAIVYWKAEPVRGVGIAVPTFIPPLAAAIVAMVLSWRRAPALAYICGSMGTLIGADLLNLDKIPELDAPVVSIGGAGTFDGVFLSGILAVLLSPGPATPEPAKASEPLPPRT